MVFQGAVEGCSGMLKPLLSGQCPCPIRLGYLFTYPEYSVA